MKREQLLKHAKCSLCFKPIMHATRLPLFWKVTIERFGIDLAAVQRADALGTVVGSQALAAAMGPNEDLARPMMDRRIVTVCESCALSAEANCVASMAELGAAE